MFFLVGAVALASAQGVIDFFFPFITPFSYPQQGSPCARSALRRGALGVACTSPPKGGAKRQGKSLRHTPVRADHNQT